MPRKPSSLAGPFGGSILAVKSKKGLVRRVPFTSKMSAVPCCSRTNTRPVSSAGERSISGFFRPEAKGWIGRTSLRLDCQNISYTQAYIL